MNVEVCKVCEGRDIAMLYRIRAGVDDDFKLLECCDCGFRFIDARDQLAGHNVDEEITEADRERTAAAVAEGLESNGERIDRNAALLLEHMSKDGALVDVGCGAGGFLQRVRNSCGSIEGLEIDAQRRDYTRSRGFEVSPHPLEHQSWDAKVAHFDAVTLWDVIEHVNDPLPLTRRIHALLRPGGVVLMDTPSRDGLFYRIGNTIAALTGGRKGKMMTMQYSSLPGSHKQIFREQDMRRMLQAAGFENISVEHRFELSFPIEFYLRHFVANAKVRAMVSPVLSLVFKLLPINNKLIVVATKWPRGLGRDPASERSEQRPPTRR